MLAIGARNEPTVTTGGQFLQGNKHTICSLYIELCIDLYVMMIVKELLSSLSDLCIGLNVMKNIQELLID